MRVSLREDGVAIAALVAITLLLFFPALTGHLFELRDFPRWTWPSRELFRNAILSGRLPQWNPTVGLGVPTMALPVHGSFYPGHLLLLLAPTQWSLGATWALHAAFGGVGAYLLARALECRPTAAWINGAAACIGGYAVSMWGNGEKVLSGSWVPWAALAILLVARAPKWIGFGAFAFAMIALAGDPFLWLHAFVLGLAAATQRSWRVAPMLGIAALLAAPALVPAFALVGQTERSGGVLAEEALRWSMHPVRLFELIAPGALGDPYDMTQYPGARYVYEPLLGATPWALSLYAGVAVILFAPFARRPWLAGAAIAFVVLALGKYSALDPAVRTVLFPLRYMRYPEKHALLVVSALALLASLGCERVLRREVRLRFVIIPFVIVGALVGLVANPEMRTPVLMGLAHAAVFIGVLLGAIVLSRSKPKLTPLVAVAVSLDLFLAAIPLLRFVDVPRSAPPIAAHLQKVPLPRLYRPRHAGTELATLPENVGEIWGIAHVPGHDAANPARFHQLWDRLSGEQAMTLFAIDWMLLPANSVPPAMTPEAAFGDLRLIRWPAQRVRLDGACQYERYAPESIALRCNANSETRVVLAEAYAPGWTATVDGAPVPILQVDEVLRGLDLKPGQHLIEMRYRTPGLTLGLVLCALGVLTLLLAGRVSAAAR